MRNVNFPRKNKGQWIGKQRKTLRLNFLIFHLTFTHLLLTQLLLLLIFIHLIDFYPIFLGAY